MPDKLTINGLLAEIQEINTANGWYEDKDELLTPSHPLAKIAGTWPLAHAVTGLIEHFRKPGTSSLAECVTAIETAAGNLVWYGAESVARGVFSETDQDAKVFGSKVAAISRLRLIDTETDEAVEAVLEGNTLHVREEVADIIIRAVDFVVAWNLAHPGAQIDIATGIQDKLAINRTRGYRHGGKKA